MNVLISPLSINSDTISYLSRPLSVTIVAPTNGRTFGWLRFFHTTTSLQNTYMTANVNVTVLPHCNQNTNPYALLLTDSVSCIDLHHFYNDPLAVVSSKADFRVPATSMRVLTLAGRDLSRVWKEFSPSANSGQVANAARSNRCAQFIVSQNLFPIRHRW